MRSGCWKKKLRSQGQTESTYQSKRKGEGKGKGNPYQCVWCTWAHAWWDGGRFRPRVWRPWWCQRWAGRGRGCCQLITWWSSSFRFYKYNICMSWRSAGRCLQYSISMGVWDVRVSMGWNAKPIAIDHQLQLQTEKQSSIRACRWLPPSLRVPWSRCEPLHFLSPENICDDLRIVFRGRLLEAKTSWDVPAWSNPAIIFLQTSALWTEPNKSNNLRDKPMLFAPYIIFWLSVVWHSYLQPVCTIDLYDWHWKTFQHMSQLLSFSHERKWYWVGCSLAIHCVGNSFRSPASVELWGGQGFKL